ncbi:MAG: YkgJ family cysteine cluster protein [Thermodesulfobacteriota bacterium]|nr:YkgJ family cysteine cluster protein [Thermodesulfobacteriota bacterium]
MFKNLLKLYQYVDQTMRLVRERFPEEVKCKPGCSDCCSAIFDLSYVEAVYLAHRFNLLEDGIKAEIRERAKKALQEWQELIAAKGDPSTARIRCPLLNSEEQCDCYEARPVNCRTYGVPTVINDSGHVCGLSGFTKGKSYPSLHLAPLQQSLYEYSIELGGKEIGEKRWPAGAVLLYPEGFQPDSEK